MNSIEIKTNKLSGAIRAVSSKSDAHRNLICAALSNEPTYFEPFESSEDINATVSCLRSLGTRIEYDENGRVTVRPGEVPEEVFLDCGESGSILRFLLPVAAALGCQATFIGHGRLPERRIAPLLEALITHGITANSDKLPLTLNGKLSPGEYEIVGNESSQYLSGLIFALPLLGGDSHIKIIGPLASGGYVDMTVRTVRRFGVKLEETEDGFFIPGGQQYRSPGKVRVEGDWSNAAFFLAAGALGSGVTVSGLDLSSAQRDREIIDLLKKFGADVKIHDGDITVSPGKLTGCAVDVDQIPDLLPILAVVGCAAAGETLLYNAARLRDKESDRLASTAAMLRALGGEVEELPDALRIHGTGSLEGGRISGAGDHRIVMSGAVATAVCRNAVIIDGAAAVSKSYPRFFEDYNSLGGITNVL